MSEIFKFDRNSMAELFASNLSQWEKKMFNSRQRIIKKSEDLKMTILSTEKQLQSLLEEQDA